MRPFHVLFPLGLPVLLLNHHAASALEYMSRVAMHESFAEGRKPSGVLHSSDWYDTWTLGLLERIEDLFLALETRPVQSVPSPGLRTTSSRSFQVAMIGDSTMRLQTDGLYTILSSIITTTGERPCQCTTHREPCLCSGYGESKDDSIVLRIDYYKVAEDCLAREVVADFVYFGCGLHILHHHPSRPLSKILLESWTQYERNLENVVLAYRSSGRARGGYLGEAFMSTHAFVIDKLEDPMLGDILAYVQRDEFTLSQCYEKVDELKYALDESLFEIPAEDICTRGYFADECIVALNMRGKAVMRRLAVPIVPAYEITLNQHWATAKRDGRHYVPLIPHELADFLGIINMALREEKLLSGN
ncbi:unnamed protein product [Ascophyllum nodosum]